MFVSTSNLNTMARLSPKPCNLHMLNVAWSIFKNGCVRFGDLFSQTCQVTKPTRNEVFNAFCFFATLSLAIALAQGKCPSIYQQCGGKNYKGLTCCEKPDLDPHYVRSSANVVVCTKSDDYYSQCQPRCPGGQPCLVARTGKCVASRHGSDGLGRQYCGPYTRCANDRNCFDNSVSCVCGGGTPCRRMRFPRGCAGLGANGQCPRGTMRCPNFKGQQCGGKHHTEPKSCQPGLKCKFENEYFSQCVWIQI